MVEDEELIIKPMVKTFSLYGKCEIAKNSEEAMMSYLGGIEKIPLLVLYFLILL